MSDLKRFESEGWSERAGTYADLTGAVTARVADALLDAAGAGQGHHVLDVACGTGQIAARAAGRGGRAVGLDLAEGMVEQARRTHPQLDFHLGDAEKLPMPDTAFDAAVGGFVLNHLPHPERCAAECARVVRPGGGVAFAVWDRPERARLIGLLGEAIERAGGDRSAGVPDGPDDFRFADHGEMRGLLAGAGLEHLRVETIELSIEVEDADALWDGLLGGLVRASTSVAAQPEATRGRVREAFGELAAEFRRPGAEALDVPTVVVLGSARRSASPG